MEIIRDRLLEKVCKENITLIQAPTGFGKSTLIRQFLAKYQNITLIYLPMHSFDRYHHQFLTKLLSEIQTKIGGDYFKGSRAIIKSKEYEPELVKDKFVKELADVEEPLMFVFDGLEILSSKSTDFISKAVRYSTENMFYIFASRKKVDKDLTIKYRNSFELIESEELSFTKGEVRKVFEDRISGDDASKIKDEMGGWPFGISLINRLWSEDINIEEVTRLGRTKYDEIFKNKVFEPLNSEMKGFLLKTNLLEHFKPDIINFLWDEKGEKLLQETIDKQLFIYGDDEYGYQYHKLFSRYLTGVSEEILPERERKELFIKISKYYIKRGDTFNALLNGVRSGDIKSLNETVESSLDELMAIITPQDLEIILDSSEFKDNNPGILYLNFVYNFRMGRHQKAKPQLISCWDMAKDDYKDLTSAVIFYLTFILGILDEENGELEKFLDNIPDEYSDNTYIMNALSHRYLVKGDYNKNYKFVKKAIKSAEEDDIYRPNWISSLYLSLAKVYHRKGDFDSSLNYVEIAREKMSKDSFTKVTSLENMILLSLFLNRLDKAKKYLEQMLSREDEIPPQYRHLIFASRGLVYLEEGRLYEARDCFERATELSSIYQKQGKVIFGLHELCLVLVFLGDFESVDEVLRKYEYESDPLKLIKQSYVFIPLTLKFILEKKLSNNTLKEMIEIAENFSNKIDIRFLNLLSNIYDEDKGIIGEVSESELDEEDFQIRVVKRFLDNYTRGKDFYSESSQDEPTIKVYMLGGLRIEINGQNIYEDDWGYKRAMSLFAYILKHRRERFTKERLIGAIWPDISLEEGDGRFRVALRHIRKEFEELGIDDVIVYSGGVYFLNDKLNWCVDTEDLEDTITTSNTHRRKNNLNDALTYYKMADNLNIGDFLPNLYDEWTGSFFNYYQVLRLDVLENICNISTKLKNHEDFSEYSKKLLLFSEEDPFVIDKLNEQAEELNLKHHTIK